MGSAVKFKQSDVPRQPGELARFKVVQGPDYGSVYIVTGNMVTIGRGEENDIIISDLKASRVHADLALTNQGWIVKDRKSANGITHNGKPVQEAIIQLSHTIALGETTLEFVTADVGTTFLVAPPKTVEQVQKEQKQRDALFPNTNTLTGIGTQATAAPKNNRKMLLIGGAVLLAVALFFGDEDKPKSSKKKKEQAEKAAKDLASYLSRPEPNKAADSLFKDGLREYFSGNYNRARTQFETVLQIVPGHQLATLYLENCASSINEEVKIHLRDGKRAYDSGKLRDAKAHFERVLQFLYKDQANPAYVEAKEQSEKVQKDMSEGSY